MILKKFNKLLIYIYFNYKKLIIFIFYLIINNEMIELIIISIFINIFIFITKLFL